jgi:hypothetical protein
MLLKFTVKNKYGQQMLYPACKLSEEFLRVQGLKVFTTQAIAICKLFGIELEQVFEKVEL